MDLQLNSASHAEKPILHEDALPFGADHEINELPCCIDVLTVFNNSDWIKNWIVCPYESIGVNIYFVVSGSDIRRINNACIYFTARHVVEHLSHVRSEHEFWLQLIP